MPKGNTIFVLLVAIGCGFFFYKKNTDEVDATTAQLMTAMAEQKTSEQELVELKQQVDVAKNPPVAKEISELKVKETALSSRKEELLCEINKQKKELEEQEKNIVLAKAYISKLRKSQPVESRTFPLKVEERKLVKVEPASTRGGSRSAASRAAWSKMKTNVKQASAKATPPQSAPGSSVKFVLTVTLKNTSSEPVNTKVTYGTGSRVVNIPSKGTAKCNIVSTTKQYSYTVNADGQKKSFKAPELVL